MKNRFQIENIKAREILDSRGNWTVEVDLETPRGLFRDSAPSGASRGKYEAKTVAPKTAVENVNKIVAPELKGKDVADQEGIDKRLKELNVGANAATAVSMAICRAGAAAENLSLYQYIAQISENSSLVMPLPAFNVINGGVHAGNELDIQEFMVVPQSKKFSENLRTGSEIYQELKKIIKEKYLDLAINIGDEGGFAPPVRVPEEALNLILRAAKKLGYQNKIKLALDCAASQFYHQQEYRMEIGVFTREGLLRYYLDLIQKYPIFSLEDPFSEKDWAGFRAITKEAGKRVLIIGDDLLVTNPERIKEAYQKKACNSLLLKVNQIGTVSEAIEAARLAQSYGWKVMVSHRSGDTCDDFISDLAVGLGADFIKAGAPCRGERVAKYNRLLKIEEELRT